MTGRPPRIVIVEDDPSMSKAIARILRVGGFTAMTFATAEAALEADVAAADCLVLDVQLPGMSGFDLYRLLAAGDGRLPAIFITAHDSLGVREMAESIDDSEYLPKPFSGRALLDAVARILRVI